MGELFELFVAFVLGAVFAVMFLCPMVTQSQLMSDAYHQAMRRRADKLLAEMETKP